MATSVKCFLGAAGPRGCGARSSPGCQQPQAPRSEAPDRWEQEYWGHGERLEGTGAGPAPTGVPREDRSSILMGADLGPEAVSVNG